MMLAGPALAGPPELDAAIDAYLEDDYSQLALIRRYADAGEADALAVIGQAYLYGLGLPRDQAEGVAFLARAADAGDWPAASQLGRIYQYGNAGQAKDAAKAARYYVRAVELGDPVGRSRLEDLPRELVIAAGGERFLKPQADPPAPAAPAPTPVQAPERPMSRLDAISAFVSDGSRGATVLANARSGDADSARVLGRECLRDNVCPTTRMEAHDLLVKAANTDPSAATELGAIYRDGAWGGQVYMVQAAQWIGHAHALGLESARYMLEDLPRDAVRQAGYEQVLIDLEASDAARAARPSAPSPSPAPPQVAAGPSPQAPSAPPEPGALANALADVIFGTSTTPEPLRLNDGTAFPIFVDTPLSGMGDGAASCLVMMRPAIEAMEKDYIALYDTMEGQSAVSSLGTLSKLTVKETELDVMEMYFDMARDTLNDPERNGGLSGDAVTWEVAKHQRAADLRPQTGPSAKLCADKMIELIITTTTVD